LKPRSLPLVAASLSTLFLLGAVVWSQSPAPPTPPTQLTLVARDGRRPIPITLINEQEFVALDEIGAIFQLAVRDEAGALTVTYKGKTIVLTPDQAIASVAGRLVSLPAAPSRVGRRWLVPVEFIGRAVALVYDTRLDLRKASHLLIVGDLRVPRVTTRYDLFGAGARLTIDSTPRASATITQDNDKLLLKFDADSLDLGPLPQLAQGQQALLSGVRLSEPVTLVAELGPRFGGFKASEEPVDTTTRLVIDFITVQTDTRTAPPAPPPVPEPATSLPLPVAGLRTLGVDPGHGGDDDGAHGADGVKEKDVTLAVARRIKALVEGRLGIRVLVTREEDRSVSIDERTAVANNNKADLFISLHANASLRKSASGASIFCAAFDEGAAKPAAGRPERLPVFGGGLRDIDLVAWDRAQVRYLDRSMGFAAILEEQLRGRVPVTAQPISRAPLGVLQSANMPAVLVEMGFLSNTDQEKQLAGAEFQTAFAQAVFDAVVKFRDAMPTGDAR
jgi:N-acetylmuramoyl-L-alanine amidase